MGNQRRAVVNRLGLAAGLALALVALAHPGVADRATIAVGASLIIVATAVRVAVRQRAASGLPGSARWLALLWLLAMLGSAAGAGPRLRGRVDAVRLGCPTQHRAHHACSPPISTTVWLTFHPAEACREDNSGDP